MKGLMDELSNEGRKVKRLKDHVGKLEALLGDPVGNVDGIESLLGALDRDLSSAHLDDSMGDVIASRVEPVRSKLEGWRAERRKVFYPALSARLRDGGLELRGNDPRLTVSCLTLERDDRDRVAIWYGPRHYRIARCDMDADAVAATTIDALESLERGGRDEGELFDDMLSSYVEVLSVRGGDMGDPVPISEMHRALVVRRQTPRFWERCDPKDLVPYPRMQFSHDLGRMSVRSRDGNVLTLRTATRASTKRLDDFMWVPRSFDRFEGDHCSGVSFKGDGP